MHEWKDEWYLNEWIEVNGKHKVRHFGLAVRTNEVPRYVLD